MLKLCSIDEFNKDASLRGDFNFLITRKVMNPSLLKTFVHLHQVAPSEDLLNFALEGKRLNLDWQSEYTDRYMKEMQSAKAKATISFILKLLKLNKSVTLVCYCKTGDFCHRYLLAEIINSN